MNAGTRMRSESCSGSLVAARAKVGKQRKVLLAHVFCMNALSGTVERLNACFSTLIVVTSGLMPVS